MKYQFNSDYNVLCHPRILQAIFNALNEQHLTYGNDLHSLHAKELIKKRFDLKDADIHFLSGGTMTNMVFISSCLRHYEGVLSPETGHINVHETAAIEGQGYKIIQIPNENGKIDKMSVEKTVAQFVDEHMVKPRLIYISDSTEKGTIYKKKELEELYSYAKDHDLYLYIDGARLGCALTSNENDIRPEDLPLLCDAFSIGGAKNGMLIGEALVINNKALAKDFRFHIKNKGAMISKGFLLGIQYEEAFKDDLYFEMARHSNELGTYLKDGLARLRVDVMPSPTNQIFASFLVEKAKTIIKEYGCELWSNLGERLVIRFVTSFATKREDVDELLDFIKSL